MDEDEMTRRREDEEEEEAAAKKYPDYCRTLTFRGKGGFMFLSDISYTLL